MQMKTACAGSSILLPMAHLAIPSVSKLAPELWPALPMVGELSEQAQHLGSASMLGEGPALADVKALVTHHGMGVYSLPYLDPGYCAELLAVFEQAEFHVNDEEAPEARIPEIVLEHRSKPLYDCLAVLWEHAALPLATLLWNLVPERLTSIQAAQYSTEEQPGTALHHDQDSDVTLVVNLGSEFEGGGTLVAGGLGEEDIIVPPLPVGHAMFFKGKTQLHRGLPVTSGTRTLLVHWSKT